MVGYWRGNKLMSGSTGGTHCYVQRPLKLQQLLFQLHDVPEIIILRTFHRQPINVKSDCY